MGEKQPLLRRDESSSSPQSPSLMRRMVSKVFSSSRRGLDYSPLTDEGSKGRSGSPRVAVQVTRSSLASSSSASETPKKLALSPQETVNISQCPVTPLSHGGKKYGDGDFVTIGDLHGNSGKLIFFLIKEGLASFSPAGNCQKILEFYKSGRATEFPVSAELQGLINSIIIKSPPEAPNVRLLGDEFSDRGKNDGITIELLKKLSAAQPHFEIMMSNHSIEFLRQMSGLDNELDVAGQASSSHPIKQVMQKATKTQAETDAMQGVRAFINDTYLKHLKLVSVTSQSDGGPVVFTHAPTEPAIVFHAAQALGVKTGECDTQAKIEKNIIVCSGQINQAYIRKVKEAVDDPSTSGNILKRNMSSDAGARVNYDPIAEIFWKRHARSWARNTGSWQTANGHDTGVGSTFELDNTLGKGLGSDSGEYQVLRPTP